MNVTDTPLSEEQKQYLDGFFSALKQRPFVGITPDGKFSSSPANTNNFNLATPAPASSGEENVSPWGIPYEELSQEEVWKLQENALEQYPKILKHSEDQRFPKGADVFRFKFSGLFYVNPAQDAYMMRIRIPANQMLSSQLKGLAKMTRLYAAGHADLTTRGNFQVREIPAANPVHCLHHLAEIGLTSRGTGADNIRNVTATPTAGFDPQEWIDVGPLAKAMHHFILNQNAFFGLPRKFNICFDGGGTISVVSDTNDIGFKAVSVPPGSDLQPGIYFNLLLGSVTGHLQFAHDCHCFVKPQDALSVAAAIIKVFSQLGDRTNRKKARLKYVIDDLGLETFLSRVNEHLDTPLYRSHTIPTNPSNPPLREAHMGIHPQKQAGLFYVGFAVPKARLTAEQMEAIADLAETYGSGEIRTTVWQNLLLPNIPQANLSILEQKLASLGLPVQPSTFQRGVVACTGNAGCRYAAANTKAHAQKIVEHLESLLNLNEPINIHLTGCPHSCAQHYIGDLGLLATQVTLPSGDKVEGYHVYLGGGCDHQQGIAREFAKSIPASQIPAFLESILRVYLQKRYPQESFVDFARRVPLEELKGALEDSHRSSVLSPAN